MSIEPDESIKRYRERIRRLGSALRLVRSVVNGRVNEDAIDTIRLICNHALWLQQMDQYEDELPADMTDAEYNAWYAKSKVVDGVRMGPKVEEKA